MLNLYHYHYYFSFTKKKDGYKNVLDLGEYLLCNFHTLVLLEYITKWPTE